MKIVALIAVVLVAGTPHGKGKGAPSDCLRFEVKGTLQSISGASFSLKPAKKKDGVTLRIGITPTTQVFWTAAGTLTGPAAGERVWAKGNQCGGDYTATWVLFSTPMK